LTWRQRTTHSWWPTNRSASVWILITLLTWTRRYAKQSSRNQRFVLGTVSAQTVKDSFVAGALANAKTRFTSKHRIKCINSFESVITRISVLWLVTGRLMRIFARQRKIVARCVLVISNAWQKLASAVLQEHASALYFSNIYFIYHHDYSSILTYLFYCYKWNPFYLINSDWSVNENNYCE